MSTQYRQVWTVLILFCFCSCSRHIYLDRTQFIKDGEQFPVTDLYGYKSVQERPAQSPDLAAAIAISGGGSRAANFGIGIMLGLEKISTANNHNALSEIDYLSTVSGGGFAGGAYVSALFDHHYFQKKQPFSLSAYVEDHIADDLSISYTGVLARNYFNPKVWFSYRDYGDGLEKAIDEHVLGYKRRRRFGKPRSILLGDLFVPKRDTSTSVRFPMLIPNASSMGTMAIFPFAPDILDCYQINGYTHRMRMVKETQVDPFKIPISVGIKSSGSFPVLIPNTTLHSIYNPERPYLHIMDGAMTDNQGAYTALQVLKQETTPKKVLIIVDADASGNLHTFSKKEGSKAPLGVFVSLTASGLYARRATLKKDIIENSIKLGITPIFLGFYTLLKNADAPILPERVNIKTEQLRLIELLKTNPAQLSPADSHILYELLVNIGTKYTIKSAEQELLFLAGQYIVRLEEDVIRAAME